MTNMRSLQYLLALVLVAVPSVVQLTSAQGCRCRTVTGRVSCRGAHHNAYQHDTLDLTGDCLPLVEANTMMCFLSTVNTDCCSLRPRPSDSRTIGPLNGVRYLDSPNLQTSRRFRKRRFCIYNVSMSDECPGKRVSVISVNASSSSGEERVELTEKNNGECGDYLQFDYGDYQSDKLCGAGLNDYQMRNIDTLSFLAFFWSDNEHPKQGGFRIRVSCEADSVSSSEVGSAQSP